MKTTLLILIASAGLCSAQTNTITFTNKSGEVIKGTVSLVQPDGIVYRKEGGGGKVLFTDLPKEIQEKYHYDPAKAKAAISAKQKMLNEQAMQNAQVAAQNKKINAANADYAVRSAEFFKSQMTITATVIQKLGTTVMLMEKLNDYGGIPPIIFQYEHFPNIEYRLDQTIKLSGFYLGLDTYKTTAGFDKQCCKLTGKIPDEFKNDPRAKAFAQQKILTD